MLFIAITSINVNCKGLTATMDFFASLDKPVPNCRNWKRCPTVFPALLYPFDLKPTIYYIVGNTHPSWPAR